MRMFQCLALDKNKHAINSASVTARSIVAELPQGSYIITDKGYDSEPIRVQIEEKGAVPVIPRKKNSTVGNDEMDWCLYKYRHLVENVFARLKYFRAIATRYDKLKRNFQGSVALVNLSGVACVPSNCTVITLDWK